MRTSRPWFAAAVIAAGSIVTAACSASAAPAPAGVRLPHGLFAGLRGHYGGWATLTTAPPPASAALPGANDLLAAGDAVLAATDLGIWWSADGGTSWRPVLTGIQAWSLTALRTGGYAALGDRPAKDRPGPAVLATSANGISWRVMRVRASRTGSPWPFGYGYRFALAGLGPAAVGLAVPDLMADAYGGTPMRSTDGGRSWSPIALLGGSRSLRGASTGLAITAGGRTMFVTAPGGGTRCAGAVYRSTDAGATWTLLPGSCQRYPLRAVQFVNARTGFAAGGMPAKFGGGQVVEATSDGGMTWHTRWRTRQQNGPLADSGIVRLDMVTARRGWALAGGCVGGQNLPCAGVVYTTSDGGFSWHASEGASSIAAVGPGTSRALAGDDGTHTLSITADGGRSWSLQSPPRWVSTTGLHGLGSAQLWTNTLGGYLSSDAGARWTGARWPSTARFSYQTMLAAPSGRLLGYSESLVIASSADGGQTWITSSVPDRRRDDQLLTAALGTGGSAFAVTGAGAECASKAEIGRIRKLKPGWKPPPGSSVLFTSTNGGARWNPAGSAARSASDSRRPPRPTGGFWPSSTRAADSSAVLMAASAGTPRGSARRCSARYRSCAMRFGCRASRTPTRSGCCTARTAVRPGPCTGCLRRPPRTGCRPAWARPSASARPAYSPPARTARSFPPVARSGEPQTAAGPGPSPGPGCLASAAWAMARGTLGAVHRPFRQVDVFSPEPCLGNPVAVVLDCDGLSTAQMQRFARWTNLSETTFVLPPDAAGADYRVRIFTPGAELPFAGHPTLGTCHAWLEAGHAPSQPDRIVQQCGAGLVRLRPTAEGLGFAAPPLLRSGPVGGTLIGRIAAQLGIDRAEIVDAQWADNGPGWIAVLLASADAVLGLRPGPVDLDLGVAGPYPPGSGLAFEVRAFFPLDGGTVEDPVTGSFNASLAQWLVASGRAAAPYVVGQGTVLGRRGRVHVSTDDEGTIWVAGATTTRIRGEVDL